MQESTTVRTRRVEPSSRASERACRGSTALVAVRSSNMALTSTGKLVGGMSTRAAPARKTGLSAAGELPAMIKSAATRAQRLRRGSVRSKRDAGLLIAQAGNAERAMQIVEAVLSRPSSFFSIISVVSRQRDKAMVNVSPRMAFRLGGAVDRSCAWPAEAGTPNPDDNVHDIRTSKRPEVRAPAVSLVLSLNGVLCD